jgi:hypothetical protein
LIAIPLARTLASVMVAILVTNLGRALFVPPMVAWLGDLFPATQRSQANAAFGLVSGAAAILVLGVCGVFLNGWVVLHRSCLWPLGPCSSRG